MKMMTKAYYYFLAIFFIFVLVRSAIYPYEPLVRFAETSLVFIFVPLLYYSVTKKIWWPFSWTLVVLFLVMHLYGAHHTYVLTPFGNLITDFANSFSTIVGDRFSWLFWWTRNNYDRLLHFSFGLMFLHPIKQILKYRFKISNWNSILWGLMLVLLISISFEFFEILASEFANKDRLDAFFLWEQGDTLDAYKDVFVAVKWALIIVLIEFIRNLWRKKNM